MGIKFKNNAVSTIADVGGIAATDLTLTVASGDGDAKFPSLGTDDYFYCTLVDSSGNREVVKVTARTADSFTIVRAQEGTIARAFAQDDVIEMRLTAGVIEAIADNALGAIVAAFAGLTAAANKMPYFTGPDSMSVTDLGSYARQFLADGEVLAGIDGLDPEGYEKLIYFTGTGFDVETTILTSFVRTLLDDETQAEARTTLGAQAWDPRLSDVSALTPTDGLFIVGDGSNFVGESGATARASMGAAEQGGEDQIKAWINFNGMGTISIRDSYNVSSITDNGTGNYTITWDTDFSNNDYSVSGLTDESRTLTPFSKANGSVTIYTRSIVDPYDLTDVSILDLMAIGDQ